MTSKGIAAFNAHYQTVFPDAAEFSAFIQALPQKSTPVLVFSAANMPKLKLLWQQHHLPWVTLPWYAQALLWPDSIPPGSSVPGYGEHWLYPMAATSLLPLLALDLKPEDTVLDACAAPGGKSVVMAGFLEHQTQLIVNDLSPKRVQTIHQLFFDYGLTDVKVLSGPAELLWHRFPNVFDKILLDVPCSSEQHIFRSPKQLALWSAKRIKKLVHRQYLLIKMAMRCLKPGGTLVYSTCAVTPEENELLITKFIHKYSSLFKLQAFTSPIPNSGGINLPETCRILPHLHHLDPMFVAVLQKVA